MRWKVKSKNFLSYVKCTLCTYLPVYDTSTYLHRENESRSTKDVIFQWFLCQRRNSFDTNARQNTNFRYSQLTHYQRVSFLFLQYQSTQFPFYLNSRMIKEEGKNKSSLSWRSRDQFCGGD